MKIVGIPQWKILADDFGAFILLICFLKIANTVIA